MTVVVPGVASTKIEEGDRVTYHGSMKYYHPFEFTVTQVYEHEGIPCLRLQGPKFGIWIERCRVTSVKKVEEK